MCKDRLYCSSCLELTFLFRNKAVSDGAISFYLDHFVRTRVSKLSYGTCCWAIYNNSDPEHVKRKANIAIDLAGRVMLDNCFGVLLLKVTYPQSIRSQNLCVCDSLYYQQNTQITENKEFRYSLTFNTQNVKEISVPFSCYRGELDDPKWKDLDPSMKGSSLSV